MGTLRFFEEVVSFKIRRTFGFADYREEDLERAALQMRAQAANSAPRIQCCDRRIRIHCKI